jgi:hypothetical protein
MMKEVNVVGATFEGTSFVLHHFFIENLNTYVSLTISSLTMTGDLYGVFAVPSSVVVKNER